MKPNQFSHSVMSTHTCNSTAKSTNCLLISGLKLIRHFPVCVYLLCRGSVDAKSSKGIALV